MVVTYSRRTPSIANIANFQEGLLSAKWVLGKRSRSLWKCKQKVGLVRHMLHWSPRLLNQPRSQYREKTRDLRGTSGAAHIAVASRSCNGSPYEIVAADCEEQLVVPSLQDVEDKTYSTGRRILNRQAKSSGMSTRQCSFAQSALDCPEARFGKRVHVHCPWVFSRFIRCCTLCMPKEPTYTQQALYDHPAGRPERTGETPPPPPPPPFGGGLVGRLVPV
jgi:hypothetical protein